MGYKFIQGVDAPGNDTSQLASPIDLCKAVIVCNKEAACKGFNTNGWIKSQVNSHIPQSSYSKPNQGLWIHQGRNVAVAVDEAVSSEMAVGVHAVSSEMAVGVHAVASEMGAIPETGVGQIDRNQIAAFQKTIDRLGNTVPSKQQVLDAYRLSMINTLENPQQIGLHSNTFQWLKKDQKVDKVMNILNDGTDNGAGAIVLQDLNKWAGQIMKSESLESFSPLSGINFNSVIFIVVVAFIIFQMLMKKNKIIRTLKSIFK